jgi:hypothetical protein
LDEWWGVLEKRGDLGGLPYVGMYLRRCAWEFRGAGSGSNFVPVARDGRGEEGVQSWWEAAVYWVAVLRPGLSRVLHPWGFILAVAGPFSGLWIPMIQGE